MREDCKGCLWILATEANGRATLVKFLDTTAMKKIMLDLPNLETQPATGG